MLTDGFREVLMQQGSSYSEENQNHIQLYTVPGDNFSRDDPAEPLLKSWIPVHADQYEIRI